MIIITRHDVTDEELDHIRERVEAFGLQTHLSRGEHRTVVGCIGNEELLAGVPLLSIPGVEAVHRVMKPYKLASLQFAAEPTRSRWATPPSAIRLPRLGAAVRIRLRPAWSVFATRHP